MKGADKGQGKIIAHHKNHTNHSSSSKIIAIIVQMRRLPLTTYALKVAIAVPIKISHRIAAAAGDLPPVSGASSVGSGVGAGIAAGAPFLPAASIAGSSLVLPQT